MLKIRLINLIKTFTKKFAWKSLSLNDTYDINNNQCKNKNYVNLFRIKITQDNNLSKISNCSYERKKLSRYWY